MPFTLKINPSDVTKGAANPNNIDESSLKRAGFNLSSNEVDDDYLFSRMGGWNVVFRSSIIRVRFSPHFAYCCTLLTPIPLVTQITFMKLLGTAIAAAMMAVSGTAGKSTTWSLGICAAVNFIACAHYWYVSIHSITTASTTDARLLAQVHLGHTPSDVPRKSLRAVHVQCRARLFRGRGACEEGEERGRRQDFLAGDQRGRLAVRCAQDRSTRAFLLTCSSVFLSAATATGLSPSVSGNLNLYP